MNALNMLNNTSPIVAVDSSTIPADVCGAVTFWRLDGACDFEALKAALAGTGIEPPSLPSFSEALKRACAEQAEKHLLVRPLPGRGGFVLVRETPNVNTGTHKYTDELVVKLKVEKDAQGVEHPALFRPGGELNTQRADELAGNVRAAFDVARSRLDSGDVGGWLVNLAKKLKAVSLRDSGGVYFVPRDAIPTWRVVTAALKQHSAHVVSEIPALKADEAVAAVLDALVREAEAAMAATKAALRTPEDGSQPLGSRGIATKQREAEALKEKLTSYEALLGKGLENVTEKLSEMQLTLSRAYLKSLED